MFDIKRFILLIKVKEKILNLYNLFIKESIKDMEAQRKYFVGGNWKCNGTLAFAKELVEGTLNKVEYNHDKVCKSDSITVGRDCCCSSLRSPTYC